MGDKQGGLFGSCIVQLQPIWSQPIARRTCLMGSPRFKTAILWIMLSTMLFVGCAPIQPHYLHEDGDLSHYLDTATEIDFPDVDHASLAEVTHSHEPLTISRLDYDSVWNLTLEEAISTALANSQVIRTFGAVRQFGQFVTGPAERLSSSPDGVATVFDVAIQETGQGGVEQILSNFDAVFNHQTTWDNTDRPQNINPASSMIQAPLFQQDQVTINNELSKQTAYGSQIFLSPMTVPRNPSTGMMLRRPLRIRWPRSISA